MSSPLQYLWRRWRVKYHLQPIANAALRPLHLKAEVMLGDDYDPAERRHIMSIEEYRTHYGDDAVDNKRFYNFGAGGWFHEPWTSVDYYVNAEGYNGAYIAWNISSLRPAPIESSSAYCAHSQHMIEHLTDSEVEFFFQECHRILRPNGVMRVVVPDAELAYDMWRRNDPIFFRRLRPLSPTQAFVSWFVGELVQGKDYKSQPRLSDDEVKAIFDEKGLESGLDALVAMRIPEEPRSDFANHVSWWTHKKVRNLLEKVGFAEIHDMCPGRSISPAMRDPRYFDTTQPYVTLCIDAVK